jgi:UDP-N-acetylmuramoyl-L-alanyl-D-glutamate--2,6-diaminopimelate ligase
MEKILRLIKKLIPNKIFRSLQPIYHRAMAFLGAIFYQFPSRRIKVVGITGTKGKTTTAEFVNAILEEAGFKTALMGTLRFKIGNQSRPNLRKMTMPGRFFTQKFLRQAVLANCDWVIMEMTSEGAAQFRHQWVELDALIFTNLSPEHIESHGSYEKYVAAKLSIAKSSLEKSRKRPRAIIANANDKESEKFLATKVEYRIAYQIKRDDKKSVNLNSQIPKWQVDVYETDRMGAVKFAFDNEIIQLKLIGYFNAENALAAAVFAKSLNIPSATIKKALEGVKKIPGRTEFVDENQPFQVVVDYAHTPDSLAALYHAFPNKRKICVLGNTGGGRDKWKRPKMGEIADQNCAEIILTDEDPYDENPRQILADMEKGFSKHRPEIILDRREAIRRALSLAKKDDVVLITGKGTDPFIMLANGHKLPWSDEKVVREELIKLKEKKEKGWAK